MLNKFYGKELNTDTINLLLNPIKKSATKKSSTSTKKSSTATKKSSTTTKKSSKRPTRKGTKT